MKKKYFYFILALLIILFSQQIFALRLRYIGTIPNRSIQKIIRFKRRKISKIILKPRRKVKLRTKYGRLWAKKSIDFYKNRRLKSFFLVRKTLIKTPYGKIKCRGKIEFHPNNRLKACSYSANKIRVFRNLFWVKNKIVFYANKRLKQLQLKKTGRIKNKWGHLRLKDEISFYVNGNFKTLFLAKPQYIKTSFGKILTGSRQKSSNPDLVFDSNKNLIKIFARPNSKIKTIYGYLKPKGFIQLYHNGKLQKIILNQPARIKSIFGKIKVTGFSTHPNGNIKSCTLAAPLVYKTKYGVFRASKSNDDNLFFYSKGRIKKMKINSITPIKIPGLSGVFKAIEQIKWHKNGSIFEIQIEEPKKIKTPAGVLSVYPHIRFYPNHKIYGAGIFGQRDPLRIRTPNGIILMKSELAWHEEGEILMGVLADEITIHGKKFRIDEKIGFNKNGKFLGRVIWDAEKGKWVKE